MSATPSAADPNESAPADPALVLPGRILPAEKGWEWVRGGWRLFARAPLMWIISLVIYFVVALLLNLVPIIGSLAFQVLQPVIAAGFMVACRSLDDGGEFELEHLFAGFRRHLSALLLLGVLLLAGWILIMVAFAGIVGFSLLGAFLAGNTEDMATTLLASGVSVLLGLLVALLLMAPLLAAYWFAPALVVMHGISPLAAMKASLATCMRNFLPFLVYGLVMTLFALVAAIPLGLGLLVWIPLAIASTYVAYREIFTGDVPAAIPSP